MAEFDIHLRIINHTDYSFSGSYSPESGRGVNFPVVKPGETSAVITARQKILEGAQGTFNLCCNAQFANLEDTWIVFSAEDPHFGENKFKFLKRSPFFIVNCRYGNGKPDGSPTWGSPSFPASGHPLGIQMTITPQPIVKSLSLLTYNTHLFEGSLADDASKVGRFAHLTDKRVVIADDERQAEMIQRIKELDPDLVCLQEVWAMDRQKTLAQALRQVYPFVYIVPDTGTDISFFIDWAPNVVTNTSGLIVASKFPIQRPRFQMYDHLTRDEDQWAKKGALVFSISFPISLKESATVNIGTTHAPTAIPDAQEAVKILAKMTCGSGENDSIIGGDFNLHIQVPKEYEDLNATMAEYGAHDLVEHYLPHIDKFYTDWRGGNEVAIALGTKRGADNKDRIDYVYLAPGKKSNCLKKKSARVFHDWKLANGMDVSDHYPVFVQFSVGKRRVAAH